MPFHMRKFAAMFQPVARLLFFLQMRLCGAPSGSQLNVHHLKGRVGNIQACAGIRTFSLNTYAASCLGASLS